MDDQAASSDVDQAPDAVPAAPAAHATPPVEDWTSQVPAGPTAPAISDQAAVIGSLGASGSGLPAVAAMGELGAIGGVSALGLPDLTSASGLTTLGSLGVLGEMTDLGTGVLGSLGAMGGMGLDAGVSGTIDFGSLETTAPDLQGTIVAEGERAGFPLQPIVPEGEAVKKMAKKAQKKGPRVKKEGLGKMRPPAIKPEGPETAAKLVKGVLQLGSRNYQQPFIFIPDSCL